MNKSVQLHVHSEQSLLDGLANIKEMATLAAEDGQPAIAITDHGSMAGTIEAAQACEKAGIKLIPGIELYQAKESVNDRPPSKRKVKGEAKVKDGAEQDAKKEKTNYHLCAWAIDNEGLRNLYQLSSFAWTEGFYYNPRVDWAAMAQHSAGVMVSTGCLGGQILQQLMANDRVGANRTLGRLVEIYGRDQVMVELQNHGIPEQQRTNPVLLEMAKAFNLRTVACADSHYAKPEHAPLHDCLLCQGTGAKMSDTNRFRFSGTGHHLHTHAEMVRRFDWAPEAVINTLYVAERSNVTFEFGVLQLPKYPLPAGWNSAADYLGHLAYQGALVRYGNPLPAHAYDRCIGELKVINGMQLADYFLITMDIVAEAKRRGIPVGPGRGSAAGSAISYCLGITMADPIANRLIFERFLNPARSKTMPDIDLDFGAERRHEMFTYIADRYGKECVAKIGTFTRMQARTAVKDVTRVMGYDRMLGETIARAMPPVLMGRSATIKECLKDHPLANDLRNLYQADPLARSVLDVAAELEGTVKTTGVHASAALITPGPVTNFVPLKTSKNKDTGEADVVTQFDLHQVEDLGLLKMDFLGLNNLDFIAATIEAVRGRHGVVIDVDQIPLDDPQTLALLQAGLTAGIFQLESAPMKQLLRNIHPDSIDDISAVIALYRPGPMGSNMHIDYALRKRGVQAATPFHVDAIPLLGDTYQLMVYQEQLMEVSKVFAGYDMAGADTLRKACFPRGTKFATLKMGYQPIERLMDLADKRVHVVDEDCFRSRFDNVADVWSVGVKPIFEMKTRSGHSVRATANHPFHANGRWTELSQIKVGDHVAVAERTPTQGGSKIDDADITLSALLIAEGFMPVNAPGHFTNTDEGILDTFRKLYWERFERTPSESTTNGVTAIRLRKSDLDELSSIIGPRGLSGDRQIPTCVINASTKKVARFLGVYLACDGWVDDAGLHYCSKSLQVIQSLKRMLLRIGVNSFIASRMVGDYPDPYWMLNVSDKTQALLMWDAIGRYVLGKDRPARFKEVEPQWRQTKPHTNFLGVPSGYLSAEIARRMEVTGRSARDLGVDTGGYESGKVLHKQTIGKLIHSELLHDISNGDLIWDEVASIRYVGDEECFDFTMANEKRPYAMVEDFLVHNCGKKIPALMAAEKVKFIDGCIRQGYGEEFGVMLFGMIEKFADYAFNKAHSYCYAMTTMRTAYLKSHYGVEYMAAVLSTMRNDPAKVPPLLAECRRMKIEMLPPDINSSEGLFVAEGLRSIRIGLSCIKGVGDEVAAKIIAERNLRGPFRTLADYIRRLRSRAVSANILDALIRAGAFDQLTGSRLGALNVLATTQSYGKGRSKRDDLGEQSLLDLPQVGFNDEPQIQLLPLPRRKLLLWERELMGAWITDHPLNGRENEIEAARNTQCSDVADLADSQQVVVVGTVTNINPRMTKRGQRMAIVTIEDFSGPVEIVVFPQAYGRCMAQLGMDNVLVVAGKVQKKDEEDAGNVIADTIEPLAGQTAPSRPEMAVVVQAPVVPVSVPIVRPVLLLVTGARSWPETETHVIAEALQRAARGRLVVGLLHGGATGADTIAGNLGLQAGVQVVSIPADWSMGASGGPARNQQLVDLALQTQRSLGWDIQGVAFPSRESVGTWDAKKKMEAAGIPVDTVWQPMPAPVVVAPTPAQIEAKAQRVAARTWTGAWCSLKEITNGTTFGRCGRQDIGLMREIGFTPNRAEVTCLKCLAVAAKPQPVMAAL